MSKPKPIKVVGWKCDNCHEFYNTYDEAYECCPDD